jgi:hypothetical protein
VGGCKNSFLWLHTHVLQPPEKYTPYFSKPRQMTTAENVQSIATALQLQRQISILKKHISTKEKKNKFNVQRGKHPLHYQIFCVVL